MNASPAEDVADTSRESAHLHSRHPTVPERQGRDEPGDGREGCGRPRLRVGSLFSGIGGFDLGLEWAGGFETVWFCEQDEFCQRILAKHWPGVRANPDIRTLRGADVEPVDVLVGGFPCQGLSAAGLGAGLSDARSGLWFEYLRIIRETQPRWVVVENVPPLRSRGLHTVLEGLASCGYDAEWDGISASAVGAHHQRDRFWLVAYPAGTPGGGRVQVGASRPDLAESAGSAADPQRVQLRDEQGRGGWPGRGQPPLPSDDGEARPLADSPRNSEGGVRETAGAERQRTRSGGQSGGTGREGVADAACLGRRSGDEEAGHSGTHGSEPGDGSPLVHAWEPESRLGGMADGLSARLDGRWVEPDIPRVSENVPNRKERLTALGNALVPQIAEWIGQRIMTWEEQNG